MTLLSMVTCRSDSDVAQLYVEARIAGLEVSHYPKLTCTTFDADPHPGCQLGVFRRIGALTFYKDERRWEVRARVDCSAVELATLITRGLWAVETFGKKPGHFTRKKMFTHAVSHRTGKRIVYTNVAYRLGADDLLSESVAAAAPLSVVVDQILEVAR